MSRKLERDFQSELIKELKETFVGCIVLKNDASYIQGFPDLLLLYKNQWAALEVKRASNSRLQPNQDYYVDILNDMSYAAVIHPENKEEVLNAIQRSFGVIW